jgi:hypothetical protein
MTGKTDLRLVRRCLGAAENRAAPIFGKAILMVRRTATGTFHPPTVNGVDFRPAIGAHGIHFLCFS